MHIGFITDGNRRWAKENLKPDDDTHIYKYWRETVFKVGNWCKDKGFECTFFITSINNMTKRTPQEVMEIKYEMQNIINHFLDANDSYGVRLNNHEEKSGDKYINLLIFYDFKEDCPNIPPIDMMVRTGGDLRLSGFLMKQCAYSELFFPKYYFPDLDARRLDELLEQFSSRDRRFGK